MDTMWKFLWISPNFSLYHPVEFQGHEKNKQKKKIGIAALPWNFIFLVAYTYNYLDIELFIFCGFEVPKSANGMLN